MSQASPEIFAGKFQLVRLLGRGAMGEVWLANEVGPRNFQRQVAVKRLLITEGFSEYARESFVAEAQVIARLDHPNIVRLIELGESDDRGLYLVLDYIDGAALDRVIRRGPLSEKAVALIGREVAKALDAVHTMRDANGQNLGVVHRDISPANILVGRDGRVRLSDFGVARIHGLGGEKTETGVFKGKLPYMPPEQATGTPFDGRADIFSLGITLFEGLIGTRLRKAETQGQLIAMIATERPPRVGEVAPHIRADLAAVIDQATEFNSEHRMPSAGHLAGQLHNVLYQLGANAEEQAIAELMERVQAVSSASTAANRQPWSLALSGENQAYANSARPSTSGSYPNSSMAGSHPNSSMSGSYPSAGLVQQAQPPSGSFRREPTSVPPPDAPNAASVTRIASIRDASPSVTPSRNSRTVFLAICAALVLGSLFGAAWILLLQPGTQKPAIEAAAPNTASADIKPSGATTEPVASSKPVETAVAIGTNSATLPTSKTGRVPVTPKTATVKTAEEVDSSGTGTLQVAVNPWGTVSVDGRSYGTTPLGAISLPAGTHTVVVTNPELGASRSASVKIVSGKSSAIRFDLKKSE